MALDGKERITTWPCSHPSFCSLTGTISSLNRPEARAFWALSCDRDANWSCSARDTLKRRATCVCVCVCVCVLCVLCVCSQVHG